MSVWYEEKLKLLCSLPCPRMASSKGSRDGRGPVIVAVMILFPEIDLNYRRLDSVTAILSVQWKVFLFLFCLCVCVCVSMD